ncbi:MAG: ABC transporter substrate-binding protein [Alphaproteobacteria bacterium]|nr:ABC transporter substrate-binding protein [Alphaproteobacteria bacterium]
MNRPTLTALALAAALGFASATDVSAQALTVGVGGNITSMDPHFHNLGPNNGIAQHFFDRLVHMDERQRPTPGLAESWRATDDTTWEIKLRRGVKFHDGSDFTAADVVATFKRVPWVPNSPSSFAAMVRGLDVTVPDPYTLIIKTPAPRPMLPIDLAVVNIVKGSNVEAPTADFNAGKAMIGTGPFKFTGFVPGDRVTMERNDAYWGPKPHWASATVRIMTNASARSAAWLSGDVQIIDQVQTADLPRMRQNQAIGIETITSNRLIYLHLDQNRDQTPFATDKQGAVLPNNPLKNKRVRQALSKAINREAIAQRLFDGEAIPAGSLLPPGFFGAPQNQKAEAFDLEGARKLLAEAGYPNGFGLTIHGPNDRYPEDDKVLQAIGPMFSRIGIDTRVLTQPWATFSSQASAPNYSFSVMLVGWGAGTGEMSNPLRSLLATVNPQTGYGPSNRGRYSNPQMDEVLTKALSTVDDPARAKLLAEAADIGVGDVGLIPLYYQVNLWGHRRNVAYAPRADEYTLAHMVRPAN